MRDSGDDYDSDAVADDGLPQVRVAMNEDNNNNKHAAYVKAKPSRANKQVVTNQSACSRCSERRPLACNQQSASWVAPHCELCVFFCCSFFRFISIYLILFFSLFLPFTLLRSLPSTGQLINVNTEERTESYTTTSPEFTV